MKNLLKVAAKTIIKSAADKYLLSPLQFLKLYTYANSYIGSSLSNFSTLLCMCELDSPHRIAVHDYVHDRTTSIDIPENIVKTQPHIDRCNFLYHLIDNFYIRAVKGFDDLSFYPRIEDLFGPAKVEELIVTQVVAPTPSMPTPIPTRTWDWNKQQNEAFNLIHNWLRTEKASRKQIFRLFGWAGSGKSEMSKSIADFVMNEAGKQNVPTGTVLFAAYTGKACSVLRTKGCRGADTLHSFLYKPLIDPVTGLCKEFILNYESPLRYAALLVIDEVSMVNEEMAADIMSFGCPILVLGDPAQLPPVKGEGYFTNVEPDYMLTDIERQALDNPIIVLATRARQEKSIKPGKYGESIVYDIGYHISDDMYAEHDQIICGLNATRSTINKRSRRINGRADRNPLYPVSGDKLVCLRNNKLSGLYNGTLWTSSKPTIQKVMKPIFKGSSILRPGTVDVLAFKVRSLDEVDPNGLPYIVSTQCSLHHFNENLPEPAYKDIAGTDQFTFGYGITCHKCVHPETMVETSEGFLPIRLIKSKGSIATPKGVRNYKNKVVNRIAPAIRIGCEGGYSITTTLDHKMEVWRRGIPSMVEAKDVKLWDWMRVKLGATIDVETYADLPMLPKANVRAKIHAVPTHCDEFVGEFLGLMVADGTLFKSGFRLLKRHKDVAYRFKKLCTTLFGCSVQPQSWNNAYGYQVSSTQLAAWLIIVGGMSPNKKDIPECIYRSPLSVQAAFLRGLFEDGSVSLNNKGAAEFVEFSNKSPRLVQKVQQMLLRFSIISSIRLTGRIPTLYIYGKHTGIFSDKIGFVSAFKNNRLKGYIDTERRFRIPLSKEDCVHLEDYGCITSGARHNIVNNGYLSREICRRYIDKSPDAARLLEKRLDWHWIRVEIKTLGKATSMCVEVPDGHKFLQNGFPHSNSQGSQWDSVMLYDESSSFREHKAKHLYTALTRAAERITILL